MRRSAGCGLLLLRLGHVMADRATTDSADPGMMTRHVSSDAAHDRAADAAGLSERPQGKRSTEAEDDSKRMAHFNLQQRESKAPSYASSPRLSSPRERRKSAFGQIAAIVIVIVAAVSLIDLLSQMLRTRLV